MPRNQLVDDLFMLLRRAKELRLKVESVVFVRQRGPSRSQVIVRTDTAELFAVLRRIDAVVEQIEAQAWDDINRE